MDQNSEQSSSTTTISQLAILGTDLAKHVQVHDNEIPEYDIPMYEPDVTVVNKTMIDITTFCHVSTPLNPEDVSLNPQTPSEIQSIMKSREGVKHMIPGIQHGGENIAFSCKDLNMLMFETAMNASSSEAVKRWQKRGSRNITFHDDIISGLKIEWSASALKLNYGSSPVSLGVTSYSLTYEVSDKSKKESGTIHCKLLSPYRALEWIYIDSLK